ncbi:PREDICTED: probable RNA polymerase II nuclear localization protein SLC7A6OS [Ceratosolen solmsi marchali]|uniref:Probable RNA polymerase II nuclear localization protein SLC7A6OS n=1 Tax=Ceratosolen solmsi marchali TaxID=326594 RepID=A0AAJ7DU17_9HYME|nr:PREDICTED: probable RNA polymerase II nuclear localization protein SLC7A6OS [Ceratosolen solmsi marchali]
MAAILRVKRKKDEEPLDALLISCKRQKIESDEITPLTAIVKFAGTVEKQEDSIVKHITKTFSKDVLKNNFKQHIVDITKKAREKTRQESNENRYKIISNLRSLDTSLVENFEESIVNIIDVEDTKAIVNDKTDIDYVYDLYYTQTEEVLQLENLLSVQPVENDLVFEDYYNKENEDEGDSEDSNSESNWKNDYPDSDNSEESFAENSIKNAMRNLDIENTLSSDSDDIVYGLDEHDVDKYGYMYAKYKARMMEEENSDNAADFNCDSDDSDA